MRTPEAAYLDPLDHAGDTQCAGCVANLDNPRSRMDTRCEMRAGTNLELCIACCTEAALTGEGPRCLDCEEEALAYIKIPAATNPTTFTVAAG